MKSENMTIERADQMQFLRFCAFVLICLFHMENYYSFHGLPHGNGAVSAVAFFIVLSGFVSGWSSYDKEVTCSPKDILFYVWIKIKRVYPLHLLTTLIAFSYSGIPALIAEQNIFPAVPELLQLLKNLLLIQSWFQTGYFSFNSVSWFLSTILFLYALNLPLRFAAGKIKKQANPDLRFGLFFALSASLTVLYCFLTRNMNTEYVHYVFPPARIGEYICGMSLGYLVRPLNRRFCNEGSGRKPVFSVLEILALVMAVWAMYAPFKAWTFRTVHWLLPNCILIFVFGFGRGVVSEIFRFRPLRYLGDISFECFLIHQVIIFEFVLNTSITSTGRFGKLFCMAFIFALTILSAALLSHVRSRNSSGR